MSGALMLRNVELDGRRADVLVQDGRIAAIGARLEAKAQEMDGGGGALIPGLIDHHIHLFATAARLDSVDLSGLAGTPALIAALSAAAIGRAPDVWIRAIGYDDAGEALLSRHDLDAAGIANPLRVQDRTGALWVLNSRALERVLDDAPPACVERDAAGRPTGRIWRGDAWLRARLGGTAPSLDGLSRMLAAYGVTGVTDTGASNGPEEAALLAQARARGQLRQSLCLMSADAIPDAPEYEIGPVKILPDERAAPALDEMTAHMRRARALGRCIGVHCVTAAELALALAAFETVGARRGDRLEHGGVIPHAMIGAIKDLRLTVVTQPGFIHERGDRYVRDMDEAEWPDLYRLQSLRDGAVMLAGGSDAPYGGADPWRAIQAATDRSTKQGKVLGAGERMTARAALGLYLAPAHDPGGGERAIKIGEGADLCLLRTPLAEALAAPSAACVKATIAKGEIIYLAA